MIERAGWFAAILALAFFGPVASAHSEERVGDVYELRLESTSEWSSERSSGSSSSTNTLTERVLAILPDAVELEFDLPADTSAEDRARSWQFPARVLKRPGASLELLNASELEVRLTAWLDLGSLTREACGHWVFTWTANKIECDPQSVLGRLALFDLRLDGLSDGGLHSEPGALKPEALRKAASTDGGAIYSGEFEVNPEPVRLQLAAGDVAVAEMSGQPPITIETALLAHQKDQISGTFVTTIETDVSGTVTRRTWNTHMEIVDAKGFLRGENTTLTIDRRRVPGVTATGGV